MKTRTLLLQVVLISFVLFNSGVERVTIYIIPHEVWLLPEGRAGGSGHARLVPWTVLFMKKPALCMNLKEFSENGYVLIEV